MSPSPNPVPFSHICSSQLNIWSHLVGVMLIMCLVCRFIVSDWVAELTVYDVAALGCMYASSLICLGLSTVYHVQLSGPPTMVQLYFALDLTGIVVAIVGSYIAGVHSAWPCSTLIKVMYLSPPCASAAIQLFMLAWDHDAFLSEAWSNARVALFSSEFTCRPTLHAPEPPAPRLAMALPFISSRSTICPTTSTST